jgi:hypothetical protein
MKIRNKLHPVEFQRVFLIDEQYSYLSDYVQLIDLRINRHVYTSLSGKRNSEDIHHISGIRLS